MLHKIPGLTAILEAAPTALVGRLFSLLPNKSGRKRRLAHTMRLYRSDDMGTAFVWVHEDEGEIHFNVGEVGDDAVQARYPVAAWDQLQNHLLKLLNDGFGDLSDEDTHLIQFVYPIAPDEPREAAFERREATAARIGLFLARTGQGYLHEALTGEDRMLITFRVVDFDLARVSVAEDLRSSVFDDYITIRRPAAAQPVPEHPGDALPAGLEPALS